MGTLLGGVRGERRRADQQQPARQRAPLARLGGHPRGQRFLSGSVNALRQTSLWIRLATLARPDSGSLQVKASGIDSFFLATKSFSPSSMPGSIGGAS